jgi:hypothetical protein
MQLGKKIGLDIEPKKGCVLSSRTPIQHIKPDDLKDLAVRNL